MAIKEYLPTAFAVRQPDFTVLPRSTRLAEDFRWGRERFLDEARTLARLEHAAGIVNVHDFLEANGTAYMVMALVRGETLDSRQCGGGPRRNGPRPKRRHDSASTNRRRKSPRGPGRASIAARPTGPRPI